jgi:hypothetical protein
MEEPDRLLLFVGYIWSVKRIPSVCSGGMKFIYDSSSLHINLGVRSLLQGSGHKRLGVQGSERRACQARFRDLEF